MKSTILPSLTSPASPASPEAQKNPFLQGLGERVREQRLRRGLTRQALAQAAGVSQRHLANLEYGMGNASILVLQQVAQALECPLAQLHGDPTTIHPEWLMLRELLAPCTEEQLKNLRSQIALILRASPADSTSEKVKNPSRKVALIGLRGAGKSTLGQMLARDLNVPFIELGKRIEEIAGCPESEIQALYGVNAYRRYERRALEAAFETMSEVVLAIPGGMVSEPATYQRLLSECTTVWLQAQPQDHMQRVRAQGDLRPMAASKEALEDLKAILSSRASFYSKAQIHIDTSAQNQAASFELLRQAVHAALKLSK